MANKCIQLTDWGAKAAALAIRVAATAVFILYKIIAKRLEVGERGQMVDDEEQTKCQVRNKSEA